MLNLIFDRTAADVESTGIVPDTERENRADDIRLYWFSEDDPAHLGFAAKGGRSYYFTFRGPKLPRAIYYAGRKDADGSLVGGGDSDPEHGIDYWVFTPAEDMHVGFQITDFSNSATSDEIAALEIRMYNDRGFYRYTDMNRVQAAVTTLRQVFQAAGYGIPSTPTLTSWAENDVPMKKRAEEYLRSVRQFDMAFPVVQPGADFPASMDRLDWRGANAIEEFLSRVDEAMELAASAWVFCGEVFAGEVDE